MSDQQSRDEQAHPVQVGLGMHVVIDLLSGDDVAERMEWDIVRAEEADAEAGFIGANTPLAKAILGKFVGADVAYAMGDIQRLRIIAAQPSSAPPPADAAARRAATLDDARRKAEQTTAEMFASSYGSKWGSYDMPDEQSEDDEE